MNTYKRNGNKWTINELLTLQREYELLEWSVGQIAEKHFRTVTAILSKLVSEGFINSWNEARGFNYQKYQTKSTINNGQLNQNINLVIDVNFVNDVNDSDTVSECGSDYDSETDYDYDYVDKVDKLTERVGKLETNIYELNSMVKEMVALW